MGDWIPIDRVINEPRVIRTEEKREVPPMPTPNILYILECTHIMPSKYTWLLDEKCYECKKPATVADIHVYEWKAFCDSKRCNWARWCGLSQGLAKYLANQHALKNPTHPVKVGYRLNPIAVGRREHMIKTGAIKA